MHPTARRLATLAVPTLAAAGVMLPAAQGATAAAASAGPRPVAVHDAADTKAEQRSVKQFWTEAKMEAAKPLDAPGDGSRRFASAATLLDGPDATPATVGPTAVKADAVAGSAAAASSRSPGAAWTAGGAVTRTTGRVFFTIAAGSDAGRNASCSGTAVTSANKSVVITAGHCVKIGGAFHTNWVFVPGYDRGDRPNGTWPATNLLTTPQWNSGEDMNYDVAAAVVAPQNGQSLTDVVGGQGVAFNQPRGRQMYAFGYPAASPYDGSKLVYCSGRAFDDFLSSEDQGLNCNMTGGSSGGPWFTSFNESTGAGLLNSVNSFKYNFANFWMFGPYFGPEAQAVYDAAQKTSLT
ncbi:trypsin-like serine peptidase [Microbispora sp. ATCC PTA-5024]|uniref:trypsin-like serine peptidase n=1 Tax=Microbispora sp. ATCC PTA-5024 TaxID=316330 RepID=UPI0003DC4BEC|nr:peptidase [Microbispora sp. ATCC PTA-5024]ETK35684.1 peptidase [Microbispora sp. ATCC PTA-5024]